MINYKYEVVYSTKFKKGLKKCLKQGKDINELKTVIDKLAFNEELDPKYKNHQLIFIVDKPKSIYLHHTISHIHYISNT